MLRYTALAVAFLFVAQAAPSHAAPPTENEIKAVLLFHLTQFVTWPEQAKESPEFIIGILGPDPFRGALQAVVNGEKVGNKPIRVLQSQNAADLFNCPIVYVSPQLRQPLPGIMAELTKHRVLTVGEGEKFITEGGMVRFKKTAERKIRLQVHLPRTRAKGINISAQLLRVSDVIQGDGK